jgi:hypothetical protein
VPADGSDSVPDEDAEQRPGFLPSSQRLVNPPHENPTSKQSVREWLHRRVAADEQMRTAIRQRAESEKEQS